MIRRVLLAAPLFLVPAPAVGDGWWHAQGNTICAAAVHIVRFSGVN